MADFSDGFVLSMLFGGGDLGTFRSLSDSGSIITIMNDDGEGAVYKYETVTITKKITINKTEGEGDDKTVTTTTQTFTKKIITKIAKDVNDVDENGDPVIVEKLIMETQYNGDTGEILGYTDDEEKEVTFVCPQ